MDSNDLSAHVARLQDQLAALPHEARNEVMESALLSGSAVDLCGIVFVPTPLEEDLKKILARLRIRTRMTNISGTVINVGETFELVVGVRNCTGHDLRNVQIVAGSSAFASVTGDVIFNLGDLANAAAESQVTFQCKAIAATPTPASGTNTLLNLVVRANVEPRSSLVTSVNGEILAN